MGLAWLLVLVAAALRGIWLLHGYLGTGSAFPQPLSAEDERQALAGMRAGNRQARDKLIEHNLRLVAHIVKKFDGCGENPEDLISIGTVGLIKGVETFNQDKGTRLATYAARCIENDILIPTTGGIAWNPGAYDQHRFVNRNIYDELAHKEAAPFERQLIKRASVQPFPRPCPYTVNIVRPGLGHADFQLPVPR